MASNPQEEMFPLRINYDLSIEEAISRGRYDLYDLNARTATSLPRHNPTEMARASRIGTFAHYALHFLQKFPWPGQAGIVDTNIILVQFTARNTLWSTVKSYFGQDTIPPGDKKNLGLRPAGLRELLAFGEQHPDVQLRVPVAAIDYVGVANSISRGYPGIVPSFPALSTCKADRAGTRTGRSLTLHSFLTSGGSDGDPVSTYPSPTTYKFAAIRRIAEPESMTEGEYRLVVNYSLSVEDAIALGRYDRNHNKITSANFPSRRKGTVEVIVLIKRFGRNMEPSDVIKKLHSEGLRPAELSELLAFGAEYPEVQRDITLSAYGSVWGPWWSSTRYSPMLYGMEKDYETPGVPGRALHLDSWVKCSSYARYLAVRK
jgi:hypothetical protein